jgi:uncharacterized membrane protein
MTELTICVRSTKFLFQGDFLVASKMITNRLIYLRTYIRSSLWAIPIIAIPLELATTRLLHRIDEWVGWSLLEIAVPGAQATLQAIVTATLSFTVFTFGSLLVAIQVASAQLTPRIIATTLLRDNVVKYTVGMFIFTLLFALSAQNRIETNVHQLVLFVATILGILSFAAFFYLIDYASKLLRPIGILVRVGNGGLDVIESVYPELSHVIDTNTISFRKPGAPNQIIHHAGTSAIVLGVDLKLLITEAEKANCIIEFVPQVGDFVSVGEPLFNLYGSAPTIDDSALRNAVEFGSERTMAQDPTFALRIVIDIALRALSHAINDPTTAVLAIDQLHRLLRMVGRRHLRTDEICDASGQTRIIFRTPNWEDFVNLAFSEIRKCGSNNLQVVRRLRAMIENLVQTIPSHRHQALSQQLALLDREIEWNFKHPEELALARTSDSQGLGGHAIL